MKPLLSASQRSDDVVIAPGNIHIAVSSYEYGKIAFFLPKIMVGRRFSAVCVDGTLVVSLDNRGRIVSDMSGRGCVVFSKDAWFPDIDVPLFNQLRKEVFFDGQGFEVEISGVVDRKTGRHKEEDTQPVYSPEDNNGADRMAAVIKQINLSQAQEPLPAQEITHEQPRDTAKRYVNWLNGFCQDHGYQVITEDGRLILERKDRIE